MDLATNVHNCHRIVQDTVVAKTRVISMNKSCISDCITLNYIDESIRNELHQEQNFINQK
ncbi:unnamed protein product [Acanthoscelides obtectus]|uniref:Uncharacterized protein n=1 Tax=Acanthoscelides obtectus TaxID=200917 RepID=A0A9P0PII2_ACAOB|nr:unnamed protein product [Acanthoscelides obtectus]CAK1649512.1 hypothetical protein AOBTE_LOCUS16285 [Acanthoscelides obtectus]